ncbi:hypothetical protein [Streptomyces sp. DT117]|uniref:hypothetical protein n=1 Tax=Streptomyces sp. DT117 TaxID=3393422 RepID=UPI003CE78667
MPKAPWKEPTTNDEDWSVDYRDDVREQLHAHGWTENDEGCLVKNGALWTEVNECLESGLDGPGKKFIITFPSETPAAVIVAACEAAVAA